jgi:hypothetical protein
VVLFARRLAFSSVLGAVAMTADAMIEITDAFFRMFARETICRVLMTARA